VISNLGRYSTIYLGIYTGKGIGQAVHMSDRGIKKDRRDGKVHYYKGKHMTKGDNI